MSKERGTAKTCEMCGHFVFQPHVIPDGRCTHDSEKGIPTRSHSVACDCFKAPGKGEK